MEPYDAQQMITGMCHVEPCYSTAAGTAPQLRVCGCPWSHPVQEAPGTGKLLAASCGCAGPDKKWEQGRTLTNAGRPLNRCHDMLPSSNGHMWPVQIPQCLQSSQGTTPKSSQWLCPSTSNTPAGVATVQLATTTGTDWAGNWK